MHRVLIGRRAGAMVQNRIRRVIADAVRAGLKADAFSYDVPVDAPVEQIVGSDNALVMWWLDRPSTG
jgi:hypothetical protein